MYRRFITLVVSAAIAVTGLTAQPVYADDDDVAKWIAGIAALAIIGAAVAERNDRKKKRYNNGYVHVPQPRYDGYGYSTKPYRGWKHGGKKRRDAYRLPGQCRVKRNLQGNEIRGFARGCLKRNNVNVDALPRQCAVRFRDRDRQRRVVLYTGRCLKQYGYRVARY